MVQPLSRWCAQGEGDDGEAAVEARWRRDGESDGGKGGDGTWRGRRVAGPARAPWLPCVSNVQCRVHEASPHEPIIGACGPNNGAKMSAIFFKKIKNYDTKILVIKFNLSPNSVANCKN